MDHVVIRKAGDNKEDDAVITAPEHDPV